MQENIERIHKFKEAMANYPTGVSVVTAMDAKDDPVGLTVNSFASVSLDPLLILWSIDHNASTYEEFMTVDKFAVNILAEEQAEIASLYASSDKDRFAHRQWQSSDHGLPIITGAMATLQCDVFKKVEAGDHVIFIGEIFDISVEDRAPLLYHQRKMGPLPASFHEE